MACCGACDCALALPQVRRHILPVRNDATSARVKLLRSKMLNPILHQHCTGVGSGWRFLCVEEPYLKSGPLCQTRPVPVYRHCARLRASDQVDNTARRAQLERYKCGRNRPVRSNCVTRTGCGAKLCRAIAALRLRMVCGSQVSTSSTMTDTRHVRGIDDGAMNCFDTTHTGFLVMRVRRAFRCGFQQERGDRCAALRL